MLKQNFKLKSLSSNVLYQYQKRFRTKLHKVADANVEEKTLEHESVVIANGSAGVGLQLAIKLAKLHANVCIWDNNERVLNDTQKFVKSNIGINLVSCVCDMTKREEIYKATEQTKKQLGTVTTVINTITQASERPFLDTPDLILETMFQSNVLSQLWLTKAFLPNMIKTNSGRFITVSSMAGHMGVPKLTDYCCSNAAVINFMTALKAELHNRGSSGIKTVVVCPYFSRSCKLHKHTKLRLVQGVSKDDVAERTIHAMLNNESLVFMPGWFKYPITLRWLCPHSVSNFFKNLLIKDVNPNSSENPLIEIKTDNYMTTVDSFQDKRLDDFPNTNITPPIPTEPKKEKKPEL